MESDDEFPCDDIDYSSVLESELQAIETDAYARAGNAPPTSSPPATQPAIKQVPMVLSVAATAYIPDEAVRRARERLEHVAIELEEGDEEGDEGATGANRESNHGRREADNGVEDIINLSGSQRSIYEDALVEQITLSVPQGDTSRSRPSVLQTNTSITSSASGNTTFFDAIETLNTFNTTSDVPQAANQVVDEEALEELQEGETKSKRRKNISLFKRFRKRGFFSVTDLVSPGWCEVQYDYRLRSLPYLPVADRPTQITTSTGALITLNKALATSHETIMKAGEVVHKKLEMEIHPVEVKVQTETREDVWGLRFLNMLGSLEALCGGGENGGEGKGKGVGKCREMPVVGFVRGYMVVGVIDEIVRKPVISLKSRGGNGKTPLGDATNLPDHSSPSTRTRTPSKRFTKPRPNSTPPKPAPTQQSLTTFFTSTPILTPSRILKEAAFARRRTHSLFVSDSKTRAGGTMPREENAKSGKMQLMLYKELLDGMMLEGLRGVGGPRGEATRDDAKGKGIAVESDILMEETLTSIDQVGPSTSPVDKFTWSLLWTHLDLDPNRPFSETFLSESRAIIIGNGLSESARSAICLADMTACWSEYVSKLGIGLLDPEMGEEEGENKRVGRAEMLLELVYRRVEQKSKRKKKRRERKHGVGDSGEETDLAKAIQASLSQVLTPEQEEERLLQLALAESLKTVEESASPSAEASNSEGGLVRDTSLRDSEVASPTPVSADDAEMEPLEASLFPLPTELAASETAATEGSVVVSDRMAMDVDPVELTSSDPTVTQESVTSSASTASSPTKIPSPPASQKRSLTRDPNIIGSIRFTHSRSLLSSHLATTLDFWMGRREPVGVQVEDVARCGWCEFEEGCEWRSKKADEAAEKGRKAREQRERVLSRNGSMA